MDEQQNRLKAKESRLHEDTRRKDRDKGLARKSLRSVKRLVETLPCRQVAASRKSQHSAGNPWAINPLRRRQGFLGDERKIPKLIDKDR